MKTLVFSSLMIVFLSTSISYADIIYLRNGEKIISEEVRDNGEKGVWVQGVFFNENEIERIEKISNEASALSDLIVNGIFLSEEPVAVINNEIVKVGGKVGEANVIEIGPTYVKLRIGDSIIVREVSGETNRDVKLNNLNDYYERQNKNRVALEQIKQVRELEIRRNEQESEQMMIKVRLNNVKEKYKKKADEEETEKTWSKMTGTSRDLSEDCRWDANKNELTGKCYLTDEEKRQKEIIKTQKTMSQYNQKEIERKTEELNIPRPDLDEEEVKNYILNGK